MKNTITWLLLIISVVTLLSCGRVGSSPGPSARNTVTVAGSTSVMPFTEKLAEHFRMERPRIVVDVQGGGSSAGIQAVLNRTVDIGMSSRELKDDEKTLNEIVVCHDGIAVVIHPHSPLKNLTIEQIRAIYSGKITNWKQLGWIDRGIDAVTREEGSGTRAAFEELMMGKTEISDAIMVQDSNGSVKEVVATDPYAIGYISVGVVDAKVRPLSVGGVAPTQANITARKYRIIRPFLYLTSGEPSESARFFIDYVLSREGQRILKKEGLIPVNG